LHLFAGTLVSFDSYMNLQLKDAEEIISGVKEGDLGELLIRCNNVLYVRQAPARSSSAKEGGEKAAESSGGSADGSAMEDEG